MQKLLKISAIALAAFATATAFAEEGKEKEKEYLHLKKEASKEEVRRFCGYWLPQVKQRKLEVAFEGEERKEAREAYEHRCRKHEKEGEGYEGRGGADKKGEGHEGRDRDDKKEKSDK